MQTEGRNNQNIHACEHTLSLSPSLAPLPTLLLSRMQCLYVDTINQLLVATMLDKNAYIYDLEDPAPKAVYSGHQDVIRGVGFLQESDCFITCSWDK
jgi:hypothetical protein